MRIPYPSLLFAIALCGCGESPQQSTEPTPIEIGDDAGGDSSGGIDDVVDTGSDSTDTGSPLLGEGEVCDEDEACTTGVCVRLDVSVEEGFCTSFCFDSETCPDEWACVFFANSGGDAVRVCIPDDLCFDEDEDGYGLGAGCAGLDCDDSNPDVNPAAGEACDGIDNDCDGFIDDSTVGAGAPCETGFSGVCADGLLQCSRGIEVCEPSRIPFDEVCDGIDNDCDTVVDEGAEGEPISQACYGGPDGTEGIGQCVGGFRVCEDGGFGVCSGQVLPFSEVCDGADNDCDGEVDEDAIGGSTRCDTGLEGICSFGFTGCGEDSVDCVAVNEPVEELCDGLDNDCDGLVDEDGTGTALARVCYEGDVADIGIGACVEGVQTCTGGEFGPCLGDVSPGIEICDGLDNDCDGTEDEDAVGGGASCATELPGVCALGVAGCGTGGSTGCVPIIEPSIEVCDGLDNDCDGEVDESEAGAPLSRSCYSGADETRGVGSCVSGEETCIAGLWSACVGQQLPRLELCDLADNDCDGDVDEGEPEAGARCSTGRSGSCSEGVTACDDGGLVCISLVEPEPESCDGFDNDCDGAVDEDEDGEALVRVCFEGDSDLVGIGACAVGEQVCSSGEFGPCIGDVTPATEICDGVDNDCDGTEDEEAVGGGTCVTGEPGVCSLGTVSCDTDGTTGCVRVFEPTDELCDGLDNDCDGEIDEGRDGGSLVRACYGGPDGTLGEGLCAEGGETCVAGDWSSCADQVVPAFELCDSIDNDCDGEVDEGDPEAGARCDTGSDGICAQGVTTCVDGGIECVGLFEPTDEACDGFDNDCDGAIDEDESGDALARACYDGPEGTLGEGSCVGGTATCRFGDFGGCSGQVIPVTEVCDFEDNDCDGEVDEGALNEFFVDADLDGFGDPDTIVFSCFGDGFVTNGDDCYDDNSAANPEQEGYFREDRGDGSFDYDCDGVETDFFGGFGSCASEPPLCFLETEGWLDDGGALPACGEEGIYIFDCLGNGANCDPTTATTTQRCR